MFSTVDLPLLDGPLMANRLCAGIEKVTSSRMVTFWLRAPSTRVTCSARISGSPEAAGCEGTKRRMMTSFTAQVFTS